LRCPRTAFRETTFCEVAIHLNAWIQESLISQLTEEETAAQLSTIRDRENSRGLTEIESKEARNQGGIPGSPDRAESLIMALIRIISPQTTVTLENFTAKGYEISPY
jgi:hypothetical protein